MKEANENKIQYINTLKGMGALVIIMYHGLTLFEVQLSSNIFNKVVLLLKSIGYIPVELFFFLSGFLMVYNYKDRIKNIEFIGFFKKKFEKIFPYIAINIILCTIYLVIEGSAVSTYQIVYNFLFIECGIFSGQGDYRSDLAGGGIWFIVPLFFSYLIFYCISKYKDKEKSVILYFILLLIGIIGLSSQWNQPILNGYMLRGISAFFAGALFYYISDNIKRKNKIIFSIIGIFTFLIILFRNEYNSVIDFIIVTDIIVLPSFVIFISELKYVRKFFEFNFFANFGNISLAMFVLNLPLGYFSLKLLAFTNISKNIQFIIYFILVIAVSYVTTFIINQFIFKKVRK